MCDIANKNSLGCKKRGAAKQSTVQLEFNLTLACGELACTIHHSCVQFSILYRVFEIYSNILRVLACTMVPLCSRLWHKHATCTREVSHVRCTRVFTGVHLTSAHFSRAFYNLINLTMYIAGGYIEVCYRLPELYLCAKTLVWILRVCIK